MTPQQQAEQLLSLAIRRHQGSLDLIGQSAEAGAVACKYDRLFDLVLSAMKSEDLRVRGAAIEVDLAANNLSKSPRTVTRLVKLISQDPAERPFALWRLGALGNRGVQPKLVLNHLLTFVRDRDEQTRFWAVEGLAMLGTDGAIDPLLDRFAHDRRPASAARPPSASPNPACSPMSSVSPHVPDLLKFLA